MDDLIEQLEMALEPSRELDWKIWFETSSEPADHGTDGWRRYTSSVDAALTLVPDGLLISMTIGHGKCAANVKTGSIINPGTKEFPGYGTIAIAICIAALKARRAAMTKMALKSQENV